MTDITPLDPATRDKLTARVRTAFQGLWTTLLAAAATWLAANYDLIVPDEVSVWVTLAVAAPLIAALTTLVMAAVDRVSERWPWVQWLFGIAAQAQYDQRGSLPRAGKR